MGRAGGAAGGEALRKKHLTEDQDELKPGEGFPKEMEAPGRSDILSELSKFGIQGAAAIRLIDSTHDASDVRLNYIIDKKWVLRFCNAPGLTEQRMGELNRLVGRYRAMGLKCPAFISDENGKLVYKLPTIQEVREHCLREVDGLWDEVKRFEFPHNYYVDLSQKLWDVRAGLLAAKH